MPPRINFIREGSMPCKPAASTESKFLARSNHWRLTAEYLLSHAGHCADVVMPLLPSINVARVCTSGRLVILAEALPKI